MSSGSKERQTTGIKVALVGKFYPPHVGGVESHMQDLAKGLRYVAPEVSVEVLAAQDHFAPGRTFELDGRRVRLAGTLKVIASTPLAPAFAWHLARLKVDCYHFHFPYPWGEISALALGLKAPYVVTYHMDIWRQKRLLQFLGPSLKKFLAGASRIIAFSEELAASSPWLSPLRYKTVIIPAGIDIQHWLPTERTRNEAAELRRAIGGPSPLVLFVGRLVGYKGLPHLLRAMQKVSAKLVIVGEGPEKPELTSLADSLGIRTKVHFAGGVISEQLPIWYQAADVFALPSDRAAESFGLVLAEAAVSGLPLVCAELPTGVTFVNRNGETGFVVPPGDPDALADALCRLLTDQELRKRCGQAARKRALLHFDSRQAAASTLRVYQDAIASA
jgi:glycosyltransferase involved in cell wall biosynthesis